ncbi:hypothetical protein EGT07_21600 [Herbaspirillum sp. HC18]|nr:hypothetical protein EGT07_21600 [Herbaspirillum sp. HC18]
MRASITVLAAAVLAAACGTPEQVAYNTDPVAAMAAEYGPACEQSGYARDSTQWRNCIVQTSTRDDLNRQGLFYDRYMQWYLIR